MDGYEFNKILGAITGALMVFLSISLFSGAVFSHGGGHHGRGEHEPLLYASLEAGEGAGAEAEEEKVPPLPVLLAAATVEQGEKVAAKRCRSCHKFEKGANAVGPYLYGVVGRDIASAEGFSYSDALLSQEGNWTFEKLNHFITNPKAFAPGTKMSFKGLKKPEERAELLVYLNSDSDSPLPLPEPAEASSEAEPAAAEGEPQQ